MGKRIVRVGSRDSVLAVIQAQIVIDCIRAADPSVEVELVTMKTTGDKILDRTLDQIGGKGLFVKELDLALMRGEVDFTVHSFKDLPMEENPALPIVALGRREDPRDVLILPEDGSFPEGPIGCASRRRQLQLPALFPGRPIAPVRGNVQTRLRKLGGGEYAALVLAAAGLRRLGLEDRISRVFSTEELLPAACQGILAVQARAGEDVSCLSAFDDPESHVIAAAERSFVRELDGGCSSPVAAYAVLTPEGIHLEGLYYDEADGRIERGSIEGPRGDAVRLGAELARRLKARTAACGSVALVGAGPGGRGLLTLRGAELLEQAEVVVYDRLVSRDILRMMPQDAEQIDVGKESSHHPVPQEEINRILLDRAQKGKRVVRLKGGDPFVFGRGGEELELLTENGVPFEVVPGITSAIAAPCFAGIPVTHRDYCSSLHIITGHLRAGKELSVPFESLVRLGGTLVFLMGVSSLPRLMEGLTEAGMDGATPAAVVENGARGSQRRIVATVAGLAAEAARAEIRSPSVIVVGEVCTLAERFDWFTKRPLFGRKILVTRPRESAGVLSRKLMDLGAEVVEYPCIAIEPLPEGPELSGAIRDLGSFDWLLFSSRNGVELFFAALRAHGLDSRALGLAKIGAVGSQTAQALEKFGLAADCVPEIFDGAHLAQAVAARSESGARALVCDALRSGGGLTEGLRAAGLEVERVPLYETVFTADASAAEDVRKALETGEIDAAAFTSGSAVEGFVQSLTGYEFTRVKAVCIGQQTAAAARRYGMRVTVAAQAALDALAEALVQGVSPL